MTVASGEASLTACSRQTQAELTPSAFRNETSTRSQGRRAGSRGRGTYVPDGAVNGETEVSLAGFLRANASNHLGAVLDGLLRVESTLITPNPTSQRHTHNHNQPERAERLSARFRKSE
jgi:hypothetical protein